jgi:cytochrome c553
MTGASMTGASKSGAFVQPTRTSQDRARTMRRLILIAGCLAFAARGAMGADYAAGKKKAEAACQACHGADGKTALTPEIPLLAGQYPDYLEHALRGYRSGQRDNAMMSPVAKPLTDAEIENLAWYFFKQKGLVHRY